MMQPIAWLITCCRLGIPPTGRFICARSLRECAEASLTNPAIHGRIPGMTKRLALLAILGALLAAGMKVAPPAAAMPLSQVITTIRDAGGRYVRAGASLTGSDCSGLVSVAQSLAM